MGTARMQQVKETDEGLQKSVNMEKKQSWCHDITFDIKYYILLLYIEYGLDIL